MGTPARTPLRSSRKTTRGNSRTDSISNLNPETLNFDQEVDRATITKPDVSDRDTVSESDTDNEIRSRLGQPLKDTDAEIKSRLGNFSGDTGKVRGGKRNRKSAKNTSEEEKDPEVSLLLIRVYGA